MMKVETETITIDNEEQEEKGKSKRYRIPHQCDQCGKSYAVKKALQDHIDFTHRGIRKYECQECKKCFELSTSYRKHLLSHDPTLMFQCETCGHISKSKQYYVIHKRKHTGEKPYICEQCTVGNQAVVPACSLMSLLQPFLRFQKSPQRLSGCCGWLGRLWGPLQHL